MQLTLEEVIEMRDEIIKFVRVAGEYRFCRNDDSHDSLVEGHEKALSAGTICVLDKTEFSVVAKNSMSLNVSMDPYDTDRLSLVLGKTCCT